MSSHNTVVPPNVDPNSFETVVSEPQRSAKTRDNRRNQKFTDAFHSGEIDRALSIAKECELITTLDMFRNKKMLQPDTLINRHIKEELSRIIEKMLIENPDFEKCLPQFKCNQESTTAPPPVDPNSLNSNTSSSPATNIPSSATMIPEVMSSTGIHTTDDHANRSKNQLYSLAAAGGDVQQPVAATLNNSSKITSNINQQQKQPPHLPVGSLSQPPIEDEDDDNFYFQALPIHASTTTAAAGRVSSGIQGFHSHFVMNNHHNLHHNSMTPGNFVNNQRLSSTGNGLHVYNPNSNNNTSTNANNTSTTPNHAGALLASNSVHPQCFSGRGSMTNNGLNSQRRLTGIVSPANSIMSYPATHASLWSADPQNSINNNLNSFQLGVNALSHRSYFHNNTGAYTATHANTGGLATHHHNQLPQQHHYPFSATGHEFDRSTNNAQFNRSSASCFFQHNTSSFSNNFSNNPNLSQQQNRNLHYSGNNNTQQQMGSNGIVSESTTAVALMSNSNSSTHKNMSNNNVNPYTPVTSPHYDALLATNPVTPFSFMHYNNNGNNTAANINHYSNNLNGNNNNNSSTNGINNRFEASPIHGAHPDAYVVNSAASPSHHSLSIHQNNSDNNIIIANNSTVIFPAANNSNSANNISHNSVVANHANSSNKNCPFGLTDDPLTPTSVSSSSVHIQMTNNRSNLIFNNNSNNNQSYVTPSSGGLIDNDGILTPPLIEDREDFLPTRSSVDVQQPSLYQIGPNSRVKINSGGVYLPPGSVTNRQPGNFTFCNNNSSLQNGNMHDMYIGDINGGNLSAALTAQHVASSNNVVLLADNLDSGADSVPALHPHAGATQTPSSTAATALPTASPSFLQQTPLHNNNHHNNVLKTPSALTHLHHNHHSHISQKHQRDANGSYVTAVSPSSGPVSAPIAISMQARGGSGGGATSHGNSLEEVACRTVVSAVEQNDEEGGIEAIRTFLNGSASRSVNDIQTKKLNQSLLHLAAAKGLDRLVRFLLDHGANVNARNKDGLTPLHRAAENGRVQSACLLLDAGADPIATAAHHHHQHQHYGGSNTNINGYHLVNQNSPYHIMLNLLVNSNHYHDNVNSSNMKQSINPNTTLHGRTHTGATSFPTPTNTVLPQTTSSSYLPITPLDFALKSRSSTHEEIARLIALKIADAFGFGSVLRRDRESAKRAETSLAKVTEEVLRLRQAIRENVKDKDLAESLVTPPFDVPIYIPPCTHNNNNSGVSKTAMDATNLIDPSLDLTSSPFRCGPSSGNNIRAYSHVQTAVTHQQQQSGALGQVRHGRPSSPSICTTASGLGSRNVTFTTGITTEGDAGVAYHNQHQHHHTASNNSSSSYLTLGGGGGRLSGGATQNTFGIKSSTQHLMKNNASGVIINDDEDDDELLKDSTGQHHEDHHFEANDSNDQDRIDLEDDTGNDISCFRASSRNTTSSKNVIVVASSKNVMGDETSLTLEDSSMMNDSASNSNTESRRLRTAPPQIDTLSVKQQQQIQLMNHISNSDPNASTDALSINNAVVQSNYKHFEVASPSPFVSMDHTDINNKAAMSPIFASAAFPSLIQCETPSASARHHHQYNNSSGLSASNCVNNIAIHQQHSNNLNGSTLPQCPWTAYPLLMEPFPVTSDNLPTCPMSATSAHQQQQHIPSSTQMKDDNGKPTNLRNLTDVGCSDFPINGLHQSSSSMNDMSHLNTTGASSSIALNVSDNFMHSGRTRRRSITLAAPTAVEAAAAAAAAEYSNSPNMIGMDSYGFTDNNQKYSPQQAHNISPYSHDFPPQMMTYSTNMNHIPMFYEDQVLLQREVDNNTGSMNNKLISEQDNSRVTEADNSFSYQNLSTDENPLSGGVFV